MDNSGFRRSYTTATPEFRATDPTPTVFSGYSAAGSFGTYATFSTADGARVFLSGVNVGIDASINAVPEPSSLDLCGIGVPIGLVASGPLDREVGWWAAFVSSGPARRSSKARFTPSR